MDEIKIGIDMGSKDGDKSVLCVLKDGVAHYYELVELGGYKPGDVWLSKAQVNSILLFTEDLHEMFCGEINEYTGEKMTCDACEIVAILERKMGKT